MGYGISNVWPEWVNRLAARWQAWRQRRALRKLLNRNGFKIEHSEFCELDVNGVVVFYSIDEHGNKIISMMMSYETYEQIKAGG